MNSLFDIVGEFQTLYDMATDETVDAEALNGTLEAMTGELEAKSAGYVAVLNQLDMEMSKADELAKKYAGIRDARKNAIKSMKDRLLYAMDALDKKELPAGDFTIKIQNNGGKQPLEITGDVPENMNKVIVEPDNDRIREYLAGLKEGESCEWARLKPRGKHIVIK